MPEPTEHCAVCGQEFHFQLSRCGVCRKAVCTSCAVRPGGAVFCGRVCGQIFFYGAADEESEKDSEEPEDYE
jgi:hypothetical protein